jgi:DNA-binding transcriptional regulator YhcF (GntR family)
MILFLLYTNTNLNKIIFFRRDKGMNKINWTPDKLLPIPLYKQIFDFIKNKISTGEWSIGSKLPTQMELAKVFNVNRSTIVEVFDELKAEGLIESKGSAGTIIINNTWSILTSLPPPDWEKYISKGTQKPNLNIIKIINEIEDTKGSIRLGAGELSKDMYPKAFMKDVYNDILQTDKDICGEIGQLILGQAEGRVNDREIQAYTKMLFQIRLQLLMVLLVLII